MADQKETATDQQQQPLYKVWPANNYPMLNGKCLAGPNPFVLGFVAFAIIGSSALFNVFVGIRLHVAVVVVESAIALATLCFLLKTAFTEAGIIPRVPPGTFALDKPFDDPPVLEVNGKQVKLTFCTTCQFYRPPRVKHCRRCDVCIEEFDHHCEFVSNCVGRRNYRFFLSFVLSIGLMVAFIFISLVVRMVLVGIADGGLALVTETENLVALLLVLFCFMSMGVWGLCHYHLWLVSRKTTTNEQIKGYFGGVRQHTERPSLFRNLYQVLTSPTPESKVPLRANASTDGYLRTPPDFLMYSPSHPNAPKGFPNQGGAVRVLTTEGSTGSVATDETALLGPNSSTSPHLSDEGNGAISSPSGGGGGGGGSEQPRRFVQVTMVPDDYSISDDRSRSRSRDKEDAVGGRTRAHENGGGGNSRRKSSADSELSKRRKLSTETDKKTDVVIDVDVVAADDSPPSSPVTSDGVGSINIATESNHGSSLVRRK